ncbi:MAG: ABC transporter substrate-binding protein [Thermodesulfobacteriota bacterium]
MVRTIIFLMILLAAAGAALGDEDPETGDTAPAQPAAVTVGVTPWPGSAAVYLAEEKGYFKDEGLRVTLQSVESGHLSLNGLLSGKFDLATMGDTPIARAGLRGRDIRVVATIAKTHRAVGIVARKDRSISGPEDLTGKTVGVVPGTTAQVFLYAYLATSYIDPEKVRITHIPPDKVETLLMSGEIDAVSTWAPHSDRLMEKLGNRAVLLQDPSIYTMTWNLVTSQAFVQKHPSRIRKFLRALIRANRHMTEATDRARAVVSALIFPSTRISEEEWESFAFTAELDQSLILNLEEQARWMIEKGYAQAEGPPNFLNILHTDCLKTVKPEAVQIPGK